MIKTFERWKAINTDIEIKKYLVLKSDAPTLFGNRFTIMKLVNRSIINKVDTVELERIHLFKLSTGEDINDDLIDNWLYSSDYVINNTLYQSDNLQNLLDIKDMLIKSTKYNL
jgi:hypothetical protein